MSALGPTLDPSWHALSDKVLRFFEQQWPVRGKEWSLASDFYRDLGLAGDDVEPILIAFCEHFGFPKEWVDATGCFPAEGHWFPNRLRAFAPTRTLRIRHLVNALYQGAWPAL